MTVASGAVNAARGVGARLGSLAPWKQALLLGALAAGVAVAKYGVFVFPSWIYLYDLSIHWSNMSDAQIIVGPADYLRVNFVAAVVAGILGLKSAGGFFAFHLLLALVAIAMPFLMPAVRTSVPTARLVFIAVAGGPAAAFLLTWANGYDAVTVIGLVVAAVSRNWLISSLGWFIAGINHPPLTLLALAMWLPVAILLLWRSPGARLASRRQEALRIPAAACALAIAWIVNLLVVDSWGGATSRLSSSNLPPGPSEQWFQVALQSLPLLTFSAIGVSWLVLLAPRVRRLPAAWLLMGETVLISLAVPYFIIDASRAAGLGMLAAILFFLVRLPLLVGVPAVSRVWRWHALTAIVVPIPLLWGGQVVLPGWLSFYRLGDGLTPPSSYPIG